MGYFNPGNPALSLHFSEPPHDDSFLGFALIKYGRGDLSSLFTPFTPFHPFTPSSLLVLDNPERYPDPSLP